MIVTAALSYFDDDLELLGQCLRSLPVVADRLVVADGRYERYPLNDNTQSPKAHLDFIRTTCREIGLPVKIDVARKVYAGQCEKRTRLLGLAAEGSDWIVGVDTDHVLHGARYSVRHELEQLDDDVDAVDVTYYTPLNHDRPLKETAAGSWHEALAGDYAIITGLFRALPGYVVEKHHWWYSAMKGGQRTWIWGGDGHYPHTKVHSMRAPYVVEHKCLFRRDEHVLANREFCEDRERLLRETAQEDAMVAA